MNIKDPDFWRRTLVMKIMRAIDNSDQWGALLETIMNATGVKAAMITLRDKKTCQIVNDVSLEQQYHSPLIRGFSTEHVVYYLTQLRTIDPWAEKQRTHYPHRPIKMSDICPVETVPDRRFFDWLETAGFRDTIVFELDRSHGFWTSMNLFLEYSDSPEATKAMNFANEYYELLREAWVMSQSLLKARQSQQALLQRTAESGTPTAIIDSNGQLQDKNALFDAILATDQIRVSGPNKTISFSRSVRIDKDDALGKNAFMYHVAEEDRPLFVVARPFDPDPLFAGKRQHLWVLTFTSAAFGPARQADHDVSVLTEQERALFHAIREGASVEAAGQQIGLQRSRTYDVWSSVKSKLGIANAHQIRP